MNIREEIVKYIPENSIGCEIGVFCGDFSQTLVDSGKFKKLYLVDSFSGYVSSGDKSGKNMRSFDGRRLQHIVTDRFSKFDFVDIVRNTSYNFLRNQENDSLDFIYIDTTHIYEDTKMELELSWEKVKHGGIISGHDYNKQQFPGLVAALDEFLDKYNIKNCIFTKEDILETYLFHKN